MEIEIIDISKANVPNVRFDITAWEKFNLLWTMNQWKSDGLEQLIMILKVTHMS